MTDVTPLPCPFCGGNVILFPEAAPKALLCGNDKCMVRPFTRHGTSLKTATTIWNTRAPVLTALQKPLTDGFGESNT